MSKSTALLFLIPLIAACSSGSGRDPIVEPPPPDNELGTVTSAGAQLSGSGAFAALKLDFPPNAVSQSIVVTLVSATPTELDERSALGLAADLGPDGQRFDVPISLTMPFDPMQIDDEVADESLIVIVESEGTIEELEPSAIDRTGGTLTVAVDHFSRFWAAKKEVAAPIIREVASYLPQTIGAEYEYVDDGTGRVTEEDLPNVGTVRVLEFDGLFGLYLQPEEDGSISMLGEHDADAGFQNAHEMWTAMPSSIEVPSSTDTDYTYAGFQPWPELDQPAWAGIGTATVEAIDVDPLTIGETTYEDVLHIRISSEFSETPEGGGDPVAGSSSWEFWLAEGIGPVRYSQDGGDPVDLVSTNMPL